MAMGASTQTIPCKPSCLPPFWLPTSCCRSSSMAFHSSRFLSVCPRRAHHREFGCGLHSTDGSFFCMSSFSSFLKARQSSSGNFRSFSGNCRHYAIVLNWKLEVCAEARNRSTSCARMVPNLRCQINSNGAPISCSLQLMEEEKKQIEKDFQTSNASNIAAISWIQATDKLRESKNATFVYSKNSLVGSGIPCAETTAKSGQYGFPDVQDGSGYVDSKCWIESFPELDNSSRKITSGSQFGQEYMGRADHTSDSIRCFVKNEGSTSLVPILIEKNPASNNNDMKSPPKQHSRNIGQSKGIETNGSLSGTSKEKEEKKSSKLLNNHSHDEPQRSDHYYLRKRLARIYDKVFVVDNISTARETVAKIDVKQETPVDHGEIICFSIYSGPEADFCNGKSCIWVDVLAGGGKSIIAEFAPFFEDPAIKKVWHNYSFDSHVIENYGLKVSGFHADTMHMARLWDSSRRTKGGYSLEALSGDPKVCHDENMIGKVSMKTIFGRGKLKKDGSEGKVILIPPVEDLQREERKLWISYSALDSISTLKLYESMKSKLSAMDWKLDGHMKGSMLEFYEKYWQPFGELLVRMETEGVLVDRAYLAEVEKVARTEQQIAANRFRNWVSRYCPDAKYMNVGSDAQLRQLFFGGTVNSKDPDASLPKERVFKVPNVEKVIEEGKKTPTKFRNIKLHSLDREIKTEMYTVTGWPSVSGDALKTLSGKVSAEFDFTDEAHQLLLDDNTENLPVASDGREPAYGTAYAAFGGGREGKEACHAIAALCEVCSIDSLISNFILPLQDSRISGKNGRIHCSLNINTETGRLSARRPNLQNQPALEKDRYKIRQAFVAAPGNSLIVADYGQLELRILAHLADCKSMLDAFKAGGDFHSRTAMNMYPHIREAVEQKHVLLEWHPQPGEDNPPVPLLKDAFASERRKAKMLNFSIAYGKTPVGLSRDWRVSLKEAKETVDRWYNERQEVRDWQEKRKKEARKSRRVHTLLGRARCFPSMYEVTSFQKGHIERAAINTPVQGSAADVAMCAMLEISKNARLEELGWRLLLQVHDEVILEGPTESAEAAKAIVVDCMSKPFDGKNILKVDLSVDAKCAQNWYSAK
ncbi:DNA-directed DNA polymerase [Sarracenia purpurea var. burkii]